VGIHSRPPSTNSTYGGPHVKARIPRSPIHRKRSLRSSCTSIPGPTHPVLVNAHGQLGTSTAGSAKSSAATPLSGTVRRLVATVERQQRQNEFQAKQIARQAKLIGRQGKEIRALRANG
jgi:hypothetical protein